MTARRCARRWQAAGYAGRPRLAIEPERYKGFFEAHIEQGDTLETGQAAHRRRHGDRRDLAVRHHGDGRAEPRRHHLDDAAARCRDSRWCKLLNAIDKRFPEICGPRTVWTTGRITLDPGSHSIIPGRAEALFQLRDADPAVLDRLHAELSSGRGGESRRRCEFE